MAAGLKIRQFNLTGRCLSKPKGGNSEDPGALQKQAEGVRGAWSAAYISRLQCTHARNLSAVIPMPDFQPNFFHEYTRREKMQRITGL